MMKSLLFVMLLASAELVAQIQISSESRRQLSELAAYQQREKNEISNISLFEKYPVILIESEVYVSCIGQVNAQFNRQVLPEGVFIGTRIKNIVTIKVPLFDLSLIQRIEGLVALELGQKIIPDLNRAIKDTRVDSVHEGYNLPRPFTGKDVVIGIQDWGFDYTHPMFYDTSLQQTRIIASWDQFRRSGNPPSGYNYGTEITGQSDLFLFKSDTACLYYDYATHGSHVAGIAGGSGAGINNTGMAFESTFLFSQFYLDAGSSIDAVQWMKTTAEKLGKRLVTNMSWGLYHIGPADGTSLLSQAFDAFAEQGVVMVTSNGNNGGELFHILNEFKADTIMSKINFYPYSAHPSMWGQSINMWGDSGHRFASCIEVHNSTGFLIKSPFYFTANSPNYTDTFLITGMDTVFYNVTVDSAFPQNQKPHIRLRVKNTNTALSVLLKSTANSGKVHYWNVTELSNGAGNWGQNFTKFKGQGISGDDEYSVGEPASTKSIISVGAHSNEIWLNPTNVITGNLASFSSLGPTVDGRTKPEITAPGVSITSSISSFTTASYTVSDVVDFNGKQYDFAAFSGTSMSGPMVAGIAALILEAYPDISAAQVKEILINTAREDDKTGAIPLSGSNEWGWGKVTATEAIRQAALANSIADTKATNSSLLAAYPNPFIDNLTLNFEGLTGEYQLVIVDVNGKKWFDKTVNTGSQLTINTAALPLGLFVVRMTGNGHEESMKLLKVN